MSSASEVVAVCIQSLEAAASEVHMSIIVQHKFNRVSHL